MCARPKPKVIDRRQLLIDAARELFARRSYDQVTTTEIAKNTA
jgi:AcrR family transcriptional regulator